MRFVRRVGIVVAATAFSVGLLGVPAQAYVDTSWGCGGYCRAGH